MEEINEKQLYQEAMEQTPETLGDFVLKAMCDYPHDYGSVCVAVAACALAGVYAANSLPQGGITSYQAGFVMWLFCAFERCQSSPLLDIACPSPNEILHKHKYATML